MTRMNATSLPKPIRDLIAEHLCEIVECRITSHCVVTIRTPAGITRKLFMSRSPAKGLETQLHCINRDLRDIMQGRPTRTERYMRRGH